MRSAGTVILLLGLLGAGAALLLPSGEPRQGAAGSEGGKRVYYQFVDDAGAVHFATSLDQVPEAWRDRAGRIELEPREARPSAARDPRSGSGGAREAASGAPQVIVYTTTWCGWCRRTLAWLDSKGVAYENRDIEASASHRDELIRKSGGTNIPVVEIDGKIIRGFDAKQMARLLRTS